MQTSLQHTATHCTTLLLHFAEWLTFENVHQQNAQVGANQRQAAPRKQKSRARDSSAVEV